MGLSVPTAVELANAGLGAGAWQVGSYNQMPMQLIPCHLPQTSSVFGDVDRSTKTGGVWPLAKGGSG